MKNELSKNIEYYLSLPYEIILKRDDEGDWVSQIQELPGCIAHGANSLEALESLEEIQRIWLEDALSVGSEIPEPIKSGDLPSGKWLQRVPRSMHGKLTRLAAKEGVSLNQLVTSILAEALGARHRPEPVQSHSELAHTLWVDFAGSMKAEWKLRQRTPFDLDIVDALAANVSYLPNQMSEFDFTRMSKFESKVNESARKKELAHKA
jgi:antitoxin HicB